MSPFFCIRLVRFETNNDDTVKTSCRLLVSIRSRLRHQIFLAGRGGVGLEKILNFPSNMIRSDCYSKATALHTNVGLRVIWVWEDHSHFGSGGQESGGLPSVGRFERTVLLLSKTVRSESRIGINRRVGYCNRIFFSIFYTL